MRTQLASLCLVVFLLSMSQQLSTASPPLINRQDSDHTQPWYYYDSDLDSSNDYDASDSPLATGLGGIHNSLSETQAKLIQEKRSFDFGKGAAVPGKLRALSQASRKSHIPVDVLMKILRELERRRHLGTIDLNNADTLPSILAEISPRRDHVSVGLDLQVISRMVAERKLRKYRQQHGVNHQKLLSIGK